MRRDFKKGFINDVAIVGISNLSALLSGFMMSVVVPKIMGTTNYGYYQIFTLYMTYTALLHLGFPDGILLKHAGTPYSLLDKTKFRCYSLFYIIFQSIVAIVLLIVSYIFLEGTYRTIFIFISIDTWAINITTYYMFISQSTMRFRDYSLRNVLHALLKCGLVTCLLILFRTNQIDGITSELFVGIVVFFDIALLAWLIFSYRDITFGNHQKITDEHAAIKEYFRCGIGLTVAYQVYNLILSTDRQFTSVFFDTDTYGIYAFSYRIMTLISTVLGPISTVLLPTLKQKGKNELMAEFDSNMATFSIVAFAFLAAYYPLSVFVSCFLQEYTASLPYLKILLPTVALSSCIQIIIFNYYKVLEKNREFFKICVVVLLVGIALNGVFFLFKRTPMAFSAASIFTVIFWYFYSEIYLIRNYQVKWKKNFLYALVMITIYYITMYQERPLFMGMVSYMISFAVVTAAFYGRAIRGKRNP